MKLAAASSQQILMSTLRPACSWWNGPRGGGAARVDAARRRHRARRGCVRAVPQQYGRDDEGHGRKAKAGWCPDDGGRGVVGSGGSPGSTCASARTSRTSRARSASSRRRGEGLLHRRRLPQKASGARADRPELLRLIQDLQSGEVVVAEKIDRISRLPLAEAEHLVASIKAKGARLAVPGLVDLSELAAEATGVAKVVLEAVQGMLLRLALQMAHDDYEDRRERQRQGIEVAKRTGRYRGRSPDRASHERIIALRSGGKSIAETARLTGCSAGQVKRVSGAA